MVTLNIHACAYTRVSTHTGPGQFFGGSILPLLVTNSNTSWLLRLGYGMYPREKISHSNTPNDLDRLGEEGSGVRALLKPLRLETITKGSIRKEVGVTMYLFLM